MSDSTRRSPVIRALSQHECVALLERNHVGRLAFSFHDQVDIQPLGYVYEGGWIYGRTSDGAKVVTLAHNRWVAFEIDEVRDTFDWTSVVVHGSFHRIDPDVSERDRAAFAHALSRLRELEAEALAADDPVPFRTIIFRIAIGAITGRMATTSA